EGSHERWPQRNYVAIAGLGDGDTLLVPRGESLLVHLDAQPGFSGGERAWTLGGRGETLLIATAEKPAGEVPEKVGIQYRGAGGSSKQGNFTNFQGGRFRYELPPVAEPLEFHVTGGDDWFGPIKVEPIDRPKIDQLSIVARRPGSERSETFAHAGADAPLVFLADTELELRFSASVPLAGAEPPARRRRALCRAVEDASSSDAGDSTRRPTGALGIEAVLPFDRPARRPSAAAFAALFGRGKARHAAGQDSAALARAGRLRPRQPGLGVGANSPTREQARSQHAADGDRTAAGGRRAAGDRFRRRTEDGAGRVRPGGRHAGQAAGRGDRQSGARQPGGGLALAEFPNRHARGIILRNPDAAAGRAGQIRRRVGNGQSADRAAVRRPDRRSDRRRRAQASTRGPAGVAGGQPVGRHARRDGAKRVGRR